MTLASTASSASAGRSDRASGAGTRRRRFAAGGGGGGGGGGGNRTPRPTPTPRPEPTPTATPEPTPAPLARGRRYDDPVLRWLPELSAAAEANGVSVELLAAVMRVTSNGDPNVVFPDGYYGLLRVRGGEFEEREVPERLWNDPVTNVEVGAAFLGEILGRSASAETAVQEYLGPYCDPFNSCLQDYFEGVFLWRDYYAAALERPAAFGLEPLNGFEAPNYAPYELTQLLPLVPPPAIDGGDEGGQGGENPDRPRDPGDGVVDEGTIIENDNVRVTRGEDGLEIDITMPGETPEAEDTDREPRSRRGRTAARDRDAAPTPGTEATAEAG